LDYLFDWLLNLDLLGFFLFLFLIFLLFFLFFVLLSWFFNFLLLTNVSVSWKLAYGFFRFGKYGSNLKHFSCTFTITCSNDWCVYVKEATLLEELVGGVC